MNWHTFLKILGVLNYFLGGTAALIQAVQALIEVLRK